MTFPLGDLVVGGAFSHSLPFAVTGHLVLRGSHSRFLIELTGAPSAELRGRSFEFEVEENDRPPTAADRQRIADFKSQQIGAVGEMTVSLQRGLFLEWFSQNGRVVLELTDPKVEFSDGFLPPPLPEGVTRKADERQACYGPIPEVPSIPTGNSALPSVPPVASESEKVARMLRECQLVEDLMENGDEIAIADLLDGLELPEPGPGLTSEQAAGALTAALAQLALYGIAFHICEHCSISDAYQIFTEQLSKEGTAFAELRGTSYVEHYSTSDFCEECQKDF